MKLRLVAQIVRIADRVPVGSLNLDTGALATSDPSLSAAWEVLRKAGVKRSGGGPMEPITPKTLGAALAALYHQGFGWDLDPHVGGTG
jgi:hypothetical protein